MHNNQRLAIPYKVRKSGYKHPQDPSNRLDPFFYRTCAALLSCTGNYSVPTNPISDPTRLETTTTTTTGTGPVYNLCLSLTASVPMTRPLETPSCLHQNSNLPGPQPHCTTPKVHPSPSANPLAFLICSHRAAKYVHSTTRSLPVQSPWRGMQEQQFLGCFKQIIVFAHDSVCNRLCTTPGSHHRAVGNSGLQQSPTELSHLHLALPVL